MVQSILDLNELGFESFMQLRLERDLPDVGDSSSPARSLVVQPFTTRQERLLLKRRGSRRSSEEIYSLPPHP